MEGAKRRAAATATAALREGAAEVEVTKDDKNYVEVTEEDDKNAVEVTRDVPITQPEPVKQLHEEGENIICMWRSGQWFLGQVTDFDNGVYTVYFLFGKVKNTSCQNVFVLWTAGINLGIK